MKEILAGIDRLAAEELERANKAHPLFASAHEGYAVIKEELEEAHEQWAAALESWQGAWEAVKHDDLGGAASQARETRGHFAWMAGELVQAAAMCDKFAASKGGWE